jgi:hypothetical protein
MIAIMIVIAIVIPMVMVAVDENRLVHDHRIRVILRLVIDR